MNTQQETPTFNLKAVVQETGLKPDTLRAWERRYGVPAPSRTQSGHRLYSQRDIDTLKWLIARKKEGLSISRAVVLWQRLTEAGNDPLENSGARSAVVTADPQNAEAASIATQRSVSDEFSTVNRLHAAWLEACLSFDAEAANAVLTEAFAILSVETVCFEILQSGLSRIGQLWHEGRISVQQEHFASVQALGQLQRLLMAAPSPTREGRILMINPPEENHTFGPLLIAVLLRRAGWAVMDLGGNVPRENSLATVERIQPNLVILVAQQLYTTANLLDVALMLYQASVPVGFGGLVFSNSPRLRKVIPGHFLGTDISQVVQAVDQLMPSPSLVVGQHLPSMQMRDTARRFRQHSALIEASVAQQARRLNVETERLTAVARGLSRNIDAALRLGDLRYLGAPAESQSTELIDSLLVNHYQLPRERLHDFLRIYLRAIQIHLREEGEPIASWLGNLLESRVGVGVKERYNSPI